jgi:hypothetical protein
MFSSLSPSHRLRKEPYYYVKQRIIVSMSSNKYSIDYFLAQ